MKTKLSLLALLCLTATAHAGWTVKVLHPAGATSSQAYCTDGVTVGGQVDGRAAYWNIATGAVTYLTAPGVIGEVTAVRGNLQAGNLRNGQELRAVTWKGTAATMFDLTTHQALGGGQRAQVFAMNSNAVGGWGATIPGDNAYAHVWNTNGTGRKYLDGDVGGGYSLVLGMTETQAVGSFRGSHSRATIWDLATAAPTSLHPDGFADSEALACAEGVQVGYTGNRAALWRGTKESFVDLTPAGALVADLRGTLGDVHIGSYTLDAAGNGSGAALWSNESNSPTDLSQYVSSSYIRARADGLSRRSGELYIAGSAYNIGADSRYAVVWVNTVPEPATVAALTAACFLLFRHNRRR